MTALQFLILLALRDTSRESCMSARDVTKAISELMPDELGRVDTEEFYSVVEGMWMWVSWMRPDIFSSEYDGRRYFLTGRGKAIARKAFTRMLELVVEGDRT